MNVTMQVKVPVTKAQELEKRVQQLRELVRRDTEALRASILPTDPRAARAIRRAERAELDVSVASMVRATLGLGIDKVLAASDNTLLAMLRKSAVARGRPRKSA